MKKSIGLIFIFIFTLQLFAQQNSNTQNETYRIDLKDGTVLIGTIIQEDEQSIKFKTLSSVELNIPKEQIIRKEIISQQLIKAGFLYKDPNQTRLFFSPTGRALKAGQGYFSIYEIFFPFIAFGITDYITLAGGVTLFPGAEKQLLYFAPKVTPIRSENFDLSAGVLYMDVPKVEEGLGIFYGVGTFGTEKSSLTFGLGWGFFGEEVSDKPIIVIGGDVRLSKSLKLLTENWFIPDSEGSLLSFGLRFFGESLAADLGLMSFTSVDTEGFPFIPWIGFAYNFGSK